MIYLIFIGIHRGIQKLVNGDVAASNLQLAAWGMWKHILDAASCKNEDADEARANF